MHINDIIHAAKERSDLRGIEDGFRALVGYPREDKIEAAGPGFLLIAFDRTCEALQHDGSIMPRETCDALDLHPGLTYADGAAAAMVQRSRFVSLFADEFKLTNARAL